MSRSGKQDSQKVWVEVPTERVDQFNMALMKLRQQTPEKTTSQVIESAVLAQAAKLTLTEQSQDQPSVLTQNIAHDKRILRVIARREAPTARDIGLYTKTVPTDYIREALPRLIQAGLVEAVATTHSVRFRLTDLGRQEEV